MGQTPAFTYNDTQFRQEYPAFADQAAYPRATLQQYFNTAGFMVANTKYGWLAAAGATLTCLYLMTAHLASLGTIIAAQSTPGIVTGATIEKVSVTLEPPPGKTQWQWWLNLSPYGSQLLVILTAQSIGGFYTPGGMGRAGFGDRFPVGPVGRC